MKIIIIGSHLQVGHNPSDCINPGPLEFKLYEPLVIDIDGYQYRAPKGSYTDGASTPRIFRSLVPRVGRHIYGAIIHDSAYRGTLEQLNDNTWEVRSITRKEADNLFFELMVITHTGFLTRWMAYLAVRLFGRWSYNGC